MNAFDVLGDPVRRRILELLVAGASPSGVITAAVQNEFGISQPAVSQHLRVLRESGFTSVEPRGARRVYAIKPTAFSAVDQWMGPFRSFVEQRFDALETELERGKRERKGAG